jgi:chemotaxis protein MotB
MALDQQPEEDQAPGIPEWVVTFGDMMSLLLTFFIMLFSMSEIREEQRFQAIAEAMRRRFGHDMSLTSLVPGQSKPRNSNWEKMASLGRARRMDIMRGGDKVKAPVGDHPRVITIRHGDAAARGAVVYFPEGEARLTDADRRALRATAEVVGGKPQKIEIRGHTSNKPLPRNSPYKSHWDLAYARARLVADTLTDLGIEPKRIRLSVAAEHEPKHISSDPLLRRENPRVEIFMLSELAEDLEGTPDEQKSRFSPSGVP